VHENAGWFAGWSMGFGFIGLFSALNSVGMFYVERKLFIPESFTLA
jgi:hypothetical protein